MTTKKVIITNVSSQERIPTEYTDSNGDGVYNPAVLLASAENHIGSTSGHGARSTAEFSRPTDITPYAIGDVVGPAVAALIRFPNVAREVGRSLYIVRAALTTNLSTCVAQFRLYLYASSTITPIADNSPFTLLWANRASRLGHIDLSAAATEMTGSDAAITSNADVRLHVVPETNTKDIYGVLVAKTIFTPASGQSFFLALNAEQD